MAEKKLLGDEIFKRIKELGLRQFEDALSVARNVDGATDGELLDALFTFTSHLDIANPLLPVASEVFKRFMDKAGLQRTPKGVEREWCDEGRDEPAAPEQSQ